MKVGTNKRDISNSSRHPDHSILSPWIHRHPFPWIIPFGVPSYLLTDNGPQFTSHSFFAFLSGCLGTKVLTTTAYHPQTNGRTERYSRTSITHLQHYVAEHQKDRDLFVQPLTYATNTQAHRSTKTWPYSLILSRQPPRPSFLRATPDKPVTSQPKLTPQMMRKQIQARKKIHCTKRHPVCDDV